MMTQRMHVVTIEFPDADSTLGTRIQRAYDEGDMPDGSWRRVPDARRPTVEIAVVLADEPITVELMLLGANLSEYVGQFHVASVGNEEDHRDLDPCFAPATPLEVAARQIIRQRDHYSDFGTYARDEDGPKGDQCFDDWAADMLEQALKVPTPVSPA